MKKIKWCAVACCLFVCIFLVTACEDAPEHSQKSEDDNAIGLSTEQYVTIEEAKNQIQELAGKSVLGFELPEQIQLPDVVDIFKVSLYKWYPDREKDLKNAVKNMWQDYGKVDWTKKKEKRFSSKIYDTYYGSEKRDKKSGLVYSYDSDGFLCGDSLNDTELTSEDCVNSLIWNGEIRCRRKRCIHWQVGRQRLQRQLILRKIYWRNIYRNWSKINLSTKCSMCM